MNTNLRLFQQFELPAPDRHAANQFGLSVAIHDQTLVVGAPLKRATVHDNAGVNKTLPGAGAVYVFTLDGDDCILQARLQAKNKQAGAEFGRSVAISGNTIVVGAPFEDANHGAVHDQCAEPQGFNAGRVYVFERIGTHWVQQACLKASNPSNSMAFGESVAISDNALVVGAPGESSKSNGVNSDQRDHSAVYAGAAYVFVRQGERWEQEAYLKASNTDELDQFGSAVAISGNTVAIGAPNEDSGSEETPQDNSALAAGAVYVFLRDESRIWNQQAYLKARDIDAGDHFGFSVDISGDRMVIGAPFKDKKPWLVNNLAIDDPVSNVGAAYVFERCAGVWLQYASLRPPSVAAQHKFGYAVSIDDDSAIIGAPFQTVSATRLGIAQEHSSLDAGFAYLFARKGDGVWRQTKPLKALNLDIGSQFGCAVALHKTSTLIGARLGRSDTDKRNAVQSGKAYVFRY